MPFITFAFSYLVLGEKLKAYFIATALILVAAIGLQSLSSRGLAEVKISGLSCVKVFNARSALVDRGIRELVQVRERKELISSPDLGRGRK